MKADSGWLIRSPRLLIPLFAILLATLFASPAVADSPEKYSLEVTGIQQEKSNWCWATTVKMALNYLGKTGMTQCDIVKVGQGTSTCENVTGSITNQLAAYSHWNVNGTGVYTKLTFDTIIAEIYTYRRPFNAGFYWNTGGGHDVLVDGYDSKDGQWVTYIDPDDGTHHTNTYEWFAGGPGSGSDHNWGDSIYQLTATASTANVPPDVLAAAKQGLDLFQGKAAAQPSLYGFRGADEVNGARLGAGYRIHYVDPVRLKNEKTPKSLLALTLPPEKVWEFLVYANDQPKSLLTVGYQDGKYQLVHFGGDGSDMATALTNFRGFAVAKGSYVEPTVVKAGRSTFLTAQIGDQEFALAAVPPGSAALAGGMDYTQLRPAADVVKHLQNVQQNSEPGQKSGLPLGTASSPTPGVMWVLVGILTAAVLAGVVWVRLRAGR